MSSKNIASEVKDAARETGGNSCFDTDEIFTELNKVAAERCNTLPPEDAKAWQSVYTKTRDAVCVIAMASTTEQRKPLAVVLCPQMRKEAPQEDAWLWLARFLVKLDDVVAMGNPHKIDASLQEAMIELAVEEFKQQKMDCDIRELFATARPNLRKPPQFPQKDF